jgi:hypothetical protein
LIGHTHFSDKLIIPYAFYNLHTKSEIKGKLDKTFYTGANLATVADRGARSHLNSHVGQELSRPWPCLQARTARRPERRDGATPGYGRRGKTSGAHQDLGGRVCLAGGGHTVANLEAAELQTCGGISENDGD